LNGHTAPGVTSKDVSLRILGDLGADGGEYRSVEFAGTYLSALSIDERMTIPNMMAEFGAMNAYLPPDAHTFAYLDRRRGRDYTPLYPDEDAVYSEEYALDVRDLEPQIALPHSPDRVQPISAVAGQTVQQVFIGTCTNGRYEDLEAAASILRGRRVAVRTIIIPASSEVMLRAAQTGVLAALIEAGAAIGTPGCGPCMGNHMGIPAPDELTVSTANRNFRGRMGTPEAGVYLASPYVAAATAVRGVLSDPRELLS
jgi:homoaconitase/3-isopropylmalate dehydratase large subunit